MNQQELEDLYIRSLDLAMSPAEKEKFLNELNKNSELAKHLAQHKKIREFLNAKGAASFGPYFASRLIQKIQNSGVVIDRQIFSFFRKFQLAAVGVVVALLVVNVLLSEQRSIKSILGITETLPADEEIVSFDFVESLNK